LQRWAGRYVLLKERVGPRSKHQSPFDNVALRVFVRCKVDYGQGWRGSWLSDHHLVGAAVLFAAEHAVTGPMNFIERHLGFSPDGGDGSTEILVLVVLVMIVVAGSLRLTTK